jgi:hypothetical protein
MVNQLAGTIENADAYAHSQRLAKSKTLPPTSPPNCNNRWISRASCR